MMHKYVGTFADGFQVAIWSLTVEMAKFHFKDWKHQHGNLVSMKKVK